MEIHGISYRTGDRLGVKVGGGDDPTVGLRYEYLRMWSWGVERCV